MTTQVQTETVNDKLTRWQRFLAWLSAVEQALDYSHADYTDESLRALKQVVAELEARVQALEGHDQRAA